MSSKKSIFCMNTLKQFDAFAKPLEEVQIKTVWGGIVSLICFLTIGYLMISNLVEYFDNTPTEELFVDTSRNKKLQINFDIIVPKISCDFLALDAVDNTGETHLQVDHNIYKRRLDLEGQPISDPEKSDDVGNNKENNSKSISNSNKLKSNETNNTADCGSCYGAETPSIPCCNTCDDVKRAYKYKNWDFHPSSIEQCKNQSTNNDVYDKAFKEGCQIYGTLLVNRVSGSFHIAPGPSFSFNNMHVHDVHPFTSSNFNTTHIIRHLSFGQKLETIPSNNNPLDSTEFKANEGATMFQYYIKIVPTLYQRRDNTIFSTNQFSVTKHNKVIAFDRGTSGMPGIFFSYEFSPIMVKFTEKQRILGHLITQFLCNISGVFICFWIIDILMYKVSKLYNIRREHLPDNTK